ncbi:MAG: FecR family protein [Brevinematales bacterium]|nr:FecR family protein [Brevinematales bacterium]
MKKIFYFIIMTLSIVCLFANDKANYILSMYVGDVKVAVKENDKWTKAKAEMPLYESSMVKTGRESYCDVLMPKRGVFRILDNTLVIMNQLKSNIEEIKIKKGKGLFNITKKLSQGETFKVETEVAVAAVRGTQFIIDTDEKKITCRVKEGEVVLRRNVKLPAELENDEEIQSKLEVVAKANQEIELTIDENKALENLINRAKNNLAELKDILDESQRATQRKLKMIKNVRRVLKELNMFDDMQTGNLEENEEIDETQDTLQRMKNRN